MQQSGGCCGCNTTITKELELSKEQLAWIEGQKKKQGSSSCVDNDNDDSTLLSIEQQVVSACMSIDEYTVFGIIRANLLWLNVKVPKRQ
jgi:hypothetical protein